MVEARLDARHPAVSPWDLPGLVRGGTGFSIPRGLHLELASIRAPSSSHKAVLPTATVRAVPWADDLLGLPAPIHADADRDRRKLEIETGVDSRRCPPFPFFIIAAADGAPQSRYRAHGRFPDERTTDSSTVRLSGTTSTSTRLRRIPVSLRSSWSPAAAGDRGRLSRGLLRTPRSSCRRARFIASSR